MGIHFDQSRMAEVKENYGKWWRGELNRPLVCGSVRNAYAPSHEGKAPLLSQANCTDFS